MTNIQKKSLQHVSETLASFDTYVIYKTLIDALTEANIDDTVRKKIADKYLSAMSEQNKKLSSAKDWVHTLLADIK